MENGLYKPKQEPRICEFLFKLRACSERDRDICAYIHRRNTEHTFWTFPNVTILWRIFLRIPTRSTNFFTVYHSLKPITQDMVTRKPVGVACLSYYLTIQSFWGLPKFLYIYIIHISTLISHLVTCLVFNPRP